MKMQDIRNIAKERGLKVSSRINKTELIRSIQIAEGNTDCFETEHVNICGQINCLWREDCLAMQKA
ncbi:MAG: hypothetical protein WC769_04230 [Thermodesulfovibrionales bacterium]